MNSRSPFFALGAVGFAVGACAGSTQASSAASTAPSTDVVVSQPAVKVAPAEPTTTVVATTAAPPDEGVDAKYRTCGVDADCVAVDRAGCCNNGRRVAVAVTQRDVYSKELACTDAHPICPTYRRVQDDRAGACDAASHACVLK